MDGWGLPAGSRTWHAFAGPWSLCRRHSPAPARLAAEPGEGSCGACRKLAAVLAAVGDVTLLDLREGEAPAWTPPPDQRPPRKRRGRIVSMAAGGLR